MSTRIVIPSAFRDPNNPNNPHGSRENRAQHVETALQDSYTLADIMPFNVHNPGIDDRIDAVLRGRAEVAENELVFEEPSVRLRNDKHLEDVDKEPDPELTLSPCGLTSRRPLRWSSR